MISLIHTSLQRGAKTERDSLAVSTAFGLETVETVSQIRGSPNTSLKRGVNDTPLQGSDFFGTRDPGRTPGAITFRRFAAA
jgi:hypothetical protein